MKRDDEYRFEMAYISGRKRLLQMHRTDCLNKCEGKYCFSKFIHWFGQSAKTQISTFEFTWYIMSLSIFVLVVFTLAYSPIIGVYEGRLKSL